MKDQRDLLRLLLLVAALLLPAAVPQPVDEELPQTAEEVEEVSPVDNDVPPFLTAITSGVSHISTILGEREESCGRKLSEEVEKRLATIEELVEANWGALEEVEELVKAVDDKMNELLRHRHALYPQGCVEPFEEAAGGCFWPHKNPGLSWERARQRCQQAGGDLATPEDLKGVRSYLRHKLGSDFWYVWLGGSITGERRWVWHDSVDGEEQEASEDDWASTSETGDCVALNGGRGYRVMEWSCEEENWYLCERKI